MSAPAPRCTLMTPRCRCCRRVSAAPRRAGLWVLVRDERPWGSPSPPAAFYRYSADRKGVHAEALLGSCRGFLHADGYAGFDKLYAPTTPVGAPALIEVACWSHARRKLYDVHQVTASPIAFEALQQIAALFAIEAAIRARAPDDRVAARQQQARPRLDGLRTFLDTSSTLNAADTALHSTPSSGALVRAAT